MIPIYDKHKRSAMLPTIYKLAADVLRAEGVSFSVHNEGRHFKVYGKDATFDYWPGKNKWGKEKSNRYRFGIIKLIYAVKNGMPQTKPVPKTKMDYYRDIDDRR